MFALARWVAKEKKLFFQSQVGGWKEEFAAFPEVETELNAWVEEQLAQSPVAFPV